MKPSLVKAVVLRPVRWWIRAIQSDRSVVGPIRRVLLTALFLPPFCVLYACLRLRTSISGSLEVEGATHRGHRHRCRLPDLVQSYIYLFGTWEPDLTAFVERRLSTGDAVVDVGANIGYFSVLAASRVGREGRVIAVEASPEMCVALTRTIEDNEVGDIVLVCNVAASDREDTVEIFGGPSHNLGLTSTVEHRGMRRTGTIEARPLAGIVGEAAAARVRLVKIDVEGGENRVLAGLAALIPHMSKEAEILVEVSPRWWAQGTPRMEEVLAPYLKAGFHLYAIDNNYWPWRYLWPRDVTPPRRLRQSPNDDTRRLDLILSRIDADEL